MKFSTIVTLGAIYATSLVGAHHDEYYPQSQGQVYPSQQYYPSQETWTDYNPGQQQPGRPMMDQSGRMMDQSGRPMMDQSRMNAQNDPNHQIMVRIQQAADADPTFQKYKDLQIHLSNNGVVTISGMVESEKDKQTIKNKIQGVEGVKTINDQMQTTQRTR